jgi:alanyl-tRNA synthetase
MMKIASLLSNENFVTILIGKSEKRASVVASVPASLTYGIHAGEVIKRVCEVLGGSGGGKPEIAQGGGDKVEMVGKARDEGLRFIKEVLKRK